MATDDMQMKRHGCGPVKLYLQNQADNRGLYFAGLCSLHYVSQNVHFAIVQILLKVIFTQVLLKKIGEIN